MTAPIWLFRLVLTAALPLVALPPSVLQAAEPPAEERPAVEEAESSRAVRYTRALEAEPLADDATAMRQWLLRWIMETPDYTVTVCNMLDLPDEDPPALASELMLQMMAGNVAYQIEHGTEGDEASRQLAGVESVLRMYGQYLVRDANWGVPALAPLIEHDRDGTLPGYVERRVADVCDAVNGKRMALEEDAPATPFLGSFLRESHIVYPLAVPDGWKMLGEQRYETPEQGASVRFHREGDKRGWMDVFFYPVGVVTSDQRTKMAETERSNLVAAWDDALTGDPITRLTPFNVPTGRPAPHFIVTAYATDFSYLSRDTRKSYNSAMVFMVDRLYAVKLRYSAEADALSRAQVAKEAQHFARQLLPQVEISSTGDCGASGVADNAPADGCMGEDPIQPAVDEGRRELRFEYPAKR